MMALQEHPQGGERQDGCALMCDALNVLGCHTNLQLL
jgi:hypothetical protein